MSLEKFKLTLNPSGTDPLEYLMYPIEEIRKSQEKPVLSISYPGIGYKENELMGMQGQTVDLTVEFKVWNDGTDRSNDTAPTNDDFTNGEVVTLTEQITYLEDYIQDPAFEGVRWEFDHVTGDRFNDREVFFESFELPIIKRGSPKWLECRMDLTIGDVVASMEDQN